MRSVEVGASFLVFSDNLEAHLDRVMEEMIELQCGDPGIEADFATGEVTLTLMVDADVSDVKHVADPVNHALIAFRTAIHAAGGNTADWPDHGEQLWPEREPAFNVRFAGVELLPT